MGFSALYQVDASIVVLLTIGAMALASEAGYRIGKRRQGRAGDVGREHFAAVLGAILGLVALLLGFTFSMSTQRYETRRQLVVADANALNAVFLQSSMMPEPERIAFKRLLRQYIDMRMDKTLLSAEITREEFARIIRQTDELHRQMWEKVRAMAQVRPAMAGMDTMLTLLGNAQATNRERIFAYLGRVPVTIILLILGSVILAMCAVGFSEGLGPCRGTTARILLMLLLGGTVFIVLDLEQQRHGFTRIDPRPMQQVQEIVDRDPEALP